MTYMWLDCLICALQAFYVPGLPYMCGGVRDLGEEDAQDTRRGLVRVGQNLAWTALYVT